MTLVVLTVALRSTHDTVNVESNKPTLTVSAESTTPRHVVVTDDSLDSSGDDVQLQHSQDDNYNIYIKITITKPTVTNTTFTVMNNIVRAYSITHINISSI